MIELPASDIYPYGERRLTVRLLRYWNEVRGIRPMPHENDIDPDELGDDWSRCFLLQVRDIANVQDYNFTYLGKRILRAYQDGAMDEYNCHVIGPNANCLSGHFLRVIERQAPVYDEGELRTLHGHRMLYRQLLLPLGNEDKGVESIFGAVNYKVID